MTCVLNCAMCVFQSIEYHSVPAPVKGGLLHTQPPPPPHTNLLVKTGKEVNITRALHEDRQRKIAPSHSFRTYPGRKPGPLPEGLRFTPEKRSEVGSDLETPKPGVLERKKVKSEVGHGAIKSWPKRAFCGPEGLLMAAS
jgi:hypothetical protein